MVVDNVVGIVDGGCGAVTWGDVAAGNGGDGLVMRVVGSSLVWVLDSVWASSVVICDSWGVRLLLSSVLGLGAGWLWWLTLLRGAVLALLMGAVLALLAVTWQH